jgi:uncharacterized protein YndB with AHSA1/START domain
MPDILHKVGVKAPPNEAYKALSTLEGLAGWWTSDTRGDPNEGGVIAFHFGRGRVDMKVLELAPAKQVLWQVVGGAPEWIGTKVSFELVPDEKQTKIIFKHQGWKEPVEFMHHCSTKWATFLMSLKSLLETGKGAPFPDDVHITID